MSDEKLKKNLQNYKDSDGLLISMKALAGDFFKELKDTNENELKEALEAKMNAMYENFSEQNLISAKNLKNAMEGINQALVSAKEEELYELIDKKDELARAIESKREEIKRRLKISFEAAENVISSKEFSEKNEILELLNNAIIRETRMLGILKESAMNAFLTTIERGEDVGDTALAIAKNMTYVGIIGGEFSKERILEISKAIVTAACEVANEGHIFAKELVYGAVNGSKEGISRAIERLRENSKFAPDELKLNSELISLKNIDQGFISMLRELEPKLEGVAKNEIEKLLDTELDTNFAKLRRISDQASEQILARIEELKANSSMLELMNAANDKIGALKQEINERSKKLKLNFDAGEKLEGIRQDIAELEKKASEKLEDIKQLNIKIEAKKFGDRAYKAAKDFLAGIKKEKE
ncbi:hypothetical protein [Campylobacter curvus]|uniref:hypothetical protein n=1 Tax=Campylobacter curvus TaxID=200 RepID=UPI00147004B6|nr:hypothetical protein [Campylobacter curvus]